MLSMSEKAHCHLGLALIFRYALFLYPFFVLLHRLKNRLIYIFVHKCSSFLFLTDCGEVVLTLS